MSFSREFIYQAVDKVTPTLNKISAQSERMSRKMRDVGRSLTIGFTTPIVAAGTAAIMQSAKFETMEVAFSTMLKSAERGKKMLEDLTDFTARTPFQIEGVSKAAKTLLAFGVQSEQVIPLLENLGNIASGANIPLSDMAQIYGKIRAKGKLMTEELMQLAERGIPIIDLLSKSYGKTKDQIFELASQSKIKFSAVEKALGSMTTKGGIFFNMMQKQSKTTSGLWSTLVDNFKIGLDAIGDIIIENFKLKAVMSSLIKNIGVFVERLRAFNKENPVLMKWIIGITAGVATLGPILITLGLAIKAVAMSLGLVKAALIGVKILIAPLTLKFMAIAAAITGLVIAAKYVYENWETIVNKLKQLWGGIANFFKNIANMIVDAFEPIKTFFAELFSSITEGFDSVGEKLRKFSPTGAWEGFKELVGLGDEGSRALPELGPGARIIQERLQRQEVEVNFRPEGATVTGTRLMGNRNIGSNSGITFKY